MTCEKRSWGDVSFPIPQFGADAGLGGETCFGGLGPDLRSRIASMRRIDSSRLRRRRRLGTSSSRFDRPPGAVLDIVQIDDVALDREEDTVDPGDDRRASAGGSAQA